MRQTSTTRSILLAAAVLLGFLLLVGALNGFELASGLRIEPVIADRLDEVFAAQPRDASNAFDQGAWIGWLISITVALSVVLFFVSLIRKESRLPTIVLVLLGAIIVFFITRIPPPQPDIETPFEEMSNAPGAGEESIAIGELLPPEDAVDVAVERPEDAGPWSWILGGVALVGLFLVIRPRFAVIGRRRTQGDAQGLAIDTMKRAVERAEAGDDVLETVVRCYRDMIEVYRSSHYAGRHNALTPRELTGKLAGAGAPRESVEGLTTLFERARYGEIVLSAEEEAAAVGHLRVIVAALDSGNGQEPS